MKSERRHQLQQNELADALGGGLTRIEPYAKTIAIVITVLAVGAIAIALVRGRQASHRADATMNLLFGTGEEDPETYGIIRQDFEGTKVALIARQMQGDAYLAAGLEMMFTDRELADENLANAIEVYEDVAATADQPLLRSRAHWGLARAREAQGNFQEAVAAYRAVIEIDESPALVQQAEERIEAMEKPEVRSFAQWFAEHRPVTADPSTPPGIPDPAGLPDVPDMLLPEITTPPDTEAPPDSEAPPGTDAPQDDPTALPPAEDPLPPADTPLELPPADEPSETQPIEAEPIPSIEDPAAEEPEEASPSPENDNASENDNPLRSLEEDPPQEAEAPPPLGTPASEPASP